MISIYTECVSIRHCVLHVPRTMYMCFCTAIETAHVYVWLAEGLWSRTSPQWRAEMEPAPQTGTEQFCAEGQSCSVSSVTDSWGALIRACGWNCTGMHAEDGTTKEPAITVCDADTLLALPLSSTADSICLDLESQKSRCPHKEQLKSCRSVRLWSAFDSVFWAGRELRVQATCEGMHAHMHSICTA